MSQSGELDVIASHPEIAIQYDANVGFAVPIANILNILGAVVAAGSNPVHTTGSGNSITTNVQISQAIAATDATKIGLAAFNSTEFTVDANGFVSLVGGGTVESFNVDASTPPGTDPVLPSALGVVTVTGGQVAAGTTTNVIRTNSLAVNTYTIEIQRSSAQAASTIGANGVAHFATAGFAVDANGFVTLNSTGLGVLSVTGTANRITSTGGQNPQIDIAATYVGQTSLTTLGTITTGVWNGTAIGPTFGGTGQTTYATGDILYASAANTLSKLAATTNGFVLTLAAGIPSWVAASGGTVTSVSGTANRITSTGGTTPVIDISAAYVGQTSITTLGTITTGVWNGTNIALANGGTSASLTASNGGIFYSTASAGAILAGTATAGQIIRSGASAAPSWSTSTYPATNAINTILYASAANVMSALATANNGVLITSATGVPSLLAAGTTGQVLTATTGSPASWAAPATRVTTINGDTGSITGATVTIYANNAANATGASVKFTNSSATSTFTLTDASDNILIGRVAGNATLSGSSNLGIGAGSLNALTSGAQNVALGQSSQTAMTTGVQNISIGYTSLTSNQTGNGSIAIGFECLNAYTGAGSCTAIGWRCLNNSVSGSFNIGLGIGAGNAYVGAETSNIVIANTGTAAESNTLRLGTTGTGSGQVNRAFIAGITGVTTSNTQMVTINSSTGQLGVTTSVPIANGGTNATSFSTTNGMVKYDGTSLVTSTTATIDASNRIRNTAQPAFCAYSNTAVTSQTGDGTVYTVVFGTELFDNANNFDGTSTFTAPITGRYQFNISVLSQNNLATHNPNMRLNCTGIAYTFGNWGGAFAGNFVLTGSVIIPMTVGDTATVQCLTSNGTKTVGIYGAANDPRTIFSGFLVVA